MYPFSAGLYAPRSRWYVAARLAEVGRVVPERFILDEPVVFYRTEAGEAVALAGRCPHRGPARSRTDRRRRCGLRLSWSALRGRRTLLPHPQSGRDPAELPREGFPGGGALGMAVDMARRSCIGRPRPDPRSSCPWPDGPGLDQAITALLAGRGSLQLLNDNLLDLTHLSVLHADTIGGGDVGGTRERHEEADGWVRSLRWIPNAHVTDWVRKSRGIEGQVDREIMMTFAASGFHFGHDRYFPAGADHGNDRPSLDIHIFHAVTPATRTSCHYFASSAVDPVTFELSRKHPPDTGSAVKIFTEDVEAIGEIERLLGAAGDFEEVPLRADVHALRGRRMVQAMIRGGTIKPGCHPRSQPTATRGSALVAQDRQVI